MKLDNQMSGQTADLTIFLDGDTFPVKDVLKANGMSFSRDLLLDGTPVWFRHVTTRDVAASLAFTQAIADRDITVHLVDRID